MLIIPASAPVDEEPRTHPWNRTAYDEDGGAYVNFVEHPELIPTSLEDYVPHGDQAATKTFYSMLAWVNGPESAFETNDCALRPPWHQSNMFRRELCIQGRLEFLFRQHLVNLHEQNVRWLLNLLTLYMQVTDPTFYLAVTTSELVPTRYVERAAAQGLGYRFRLNFDAYGDTEEEVWGNLDRLFIGLWKVFRRLTAARSVPLPAFP